MDSIWIEDLFYEVSKRSPKGHPLEVTSVTAESSMTHSFNRTFRSFKAMMSSSALFLEWFEMDNPIILTKCQILKITSLFINYVTTLTFVRVDEMMINMIFSDFINPRSFSNWSMMSIIMNHVITYISEYNVIITYYVIDMMTHPKIPPAISASPI